MITLPLFRTAQTRVRRFHPYLVFAPSAFFSAGLVSAGAAGAASPPAGAGATAPGSPGAPPAGAAGAAGAGAGGGGAGSSFLPQPATARVKAKKATPDHKTSLFPIMIHLLSHIEDSSTKHIFYYTTASDLQGGARGKGHDPGTAVPPGESWSGSVFPRVRTGSDPRAFLAAGGVILDPRTTGIFVSGELSKTGSG